MGGHMKKISLVALIVLILGGGYLVYAQATKDKSPPANTTTQTSNQTKTSTEPATSTDPQTFTFEQQKKSAHYVSSTPETR